MIPNLRSHTDAVVAALEALELTVYGGSNGAPPKEATGKYAVVYHIDDLFSGSLENPYEDAELVYQVTCIGTTDEQAEWVVDEVMGLVDAALQVDGRHIAQIRPDGGPGPRPDYDRTPPVFYATPRFTITSTPDPEAVSA